MQGADDLDQLKRIFHLCGSPNNENMPGWESLPEAKKVTFETSSRRVKDDFMQFDPLAADLIDKLLTLDPKKRITAIEALEHDYFYSNPFPAEPSEYVSLYFQHNILCLTYHILFIHAIVYPNTKHRMSLIEERERKDKQYKCYISFVIMLINK